MFRVARAAAGQACLAVPCGLSLSFNLISTHIRSYALYSLIHLITA
jgi:hypothetical protein